MNAPAPVPETAGLGRGLGLGRGDQGESSTGMMAVAARMDPAAWPPAGHEGPPYEQGSPAARSTRVITAMSSMATRYGILPRGAGRGPEPEACSPSQVRGIHIRNVAPAPGSEAASMHPPRPRRMP